LPPTRTTPSRDGRAEREDRWFEALGIEIAAILDAAGVPFCKGG
jgi:hypothetical protein